MASVLRGRLLNHPRNAFVTGGSNVRLSSGRYRKLRGVTKPLEKHFYAHYKRRLTGRGNSSAKIGTLVHRQMESWATGKPPPMAPARTKGGVCRPYREHRFTTQFKDALNARKYKLVTCEHPLLSKQGRYLTYVDGIFSFTEPTTGEECLGVVSFKTGYGEQIIKARNHCKGAARILQNCQANHHFLQLACEVHTLRYEYGIDIRRAIVLYAGHGKKVTTRALKLPDWGYDKGFMGKIHGAMAQDGDIRLSELAHIP